MCVGCVCWERSQPGSRAFTGGTEGPELLRGKDAGWGELCMLAGMEKFRHGCVWGKLRLTQRHTTGSSWQPPPPYLTTPAGRRGKVRESLSEYGMVVYVGTEAYVRPQAGEGMGGGGCC